MCMIDDLTKKHGNGKWIELLVYCKENDPEEKPDLLAKFRYVSDAREYAAKLANSRIYTGIVIR